MIAPARVPLQPPAPPPTFVRPALGLLAGLGVTLLIVACGVIFATLAALRGVDPTRFVATPGYLVVVTAINLVGAAAGGFTTARITIGRSFFTVLLLAVIMLMSGVAHALKDAAKPGEPSWYPIGLALLAAACTLLGGALERRRAARLRSPD
jgi:hypothetical protein